MEFIADGFKFRLGPRNLILEEFVLIRDKGSYFGVGVVLGAEGEAIGDAAAIGCEFAAEIFRVEAIGGVLDDCGL